MNDSAEIADAWLKGDEQGQDSHVTRVSRCALIAHSAISRRIVMNNADP
jgi:hypothetical protein